MSECATAARHNAVRPDDPRPAHANPTHVDESAADPDARSTISNTHSADGNPASAHVDESAAESAADPDARSADGDPRPANIHAERAGTCCTSRV